VKKHPWKAGWDYEIQRVPSSKSYTASAVMDRIERGWLLADWTLATGERDVVDLVFRRTSLSGAPPSLRRAD
jgi:hypothetical protein